MNLLFRAPLLVVACLVASVGCGGSSSGEAAFGGKKEGPAVKRFPDGSIDDQSKCEWRNRQDRDVIETAGPGAIMPNVRRVFAVHGQGSDRQRVLVCREIDSNLDGTKDVFRRYNEKGDSLFEEADSNFDGKIDTWLSFAKQRVAEAKLDRNFDGNVDEWWYYSAGKLTRVKRDTNKDGKPDVWEIYGSDGKLERMGVDVDGDERVDRWDYDGELRRDREDKERAAEDEIARKKAEADKSGEYAEAKPEEETDPKKKERTPATKKDGVKKDAPTPPSPPPPTTTAP